MQEYFEMKGISSSLISAIYMAKKTESLSTFMLPKGGDTSDTRLGSLVHKVIETGTIESIRHKVNSGVAKVSNPGKNVKAVYDAKDDENQMIEAYVLNFDNATKRKYLEDKILNRISIIAACKKCIEKYEDYKAYEEAKNSSITEDDLFYIEQIFEAYKQSEAYFEEKEIIAQGGESYSETVVTNHIHYNGSRYLLKALVDKIIVDHKNKKVIIYDYKTKTVAKSLESSYRGYAYFRQASFYTYMVKAYMSRANINKDYEFIYRIVFIEKETFNITVKEVSDADLNIHTVPGFFKPFGNYDYWGKINIVTRNENVFDLLDTNKYEYYIDSTEDLIKEFINKAPIAYMFKDE